MKTFGELPTSYEVSMSYEEQLELLTRKINEIIDELEKYITKDVDDLTNYYTKQETNNLLDNKQNKITQTNKLDYSLIDNAPTIPSKTSDLTNDSDFTTKTYVDGLVGDINSALDTINGEVI